MNIENRLKLFRTEKTKILGFGRSHLRSVDLARRLETDVEKKIRKAKKEFTSKQAFLFFLWDAVKDRGDELLRREHFQFRVFDEGTVEFLDQSFIMRPGNGFATRYEDVAQEMALLPEKVRAVLQLHYQGGLGCKSIGKKIGVSIEEVYQLWQHSLIYLWEALQNGESEGFQEQDDEAFWTMALKYLDGTASEKFVAELNSEIHVSKTRTRQYNDLRMIDGIMIGFGELNLWPKCELAEERLKISNKRFRGRSRRKKEAANPEAHKEAEPAKFAVLVLGILATVLSTTGKLVEKILPKSKDESSPESKEEEVSAVATRELPAPPSSTIPPPPTPPELAVVVPEAEPEEEIVELPAEPPVPVLANEDFDQSRRHGVHIDQPSRLPRININPAFLKKLGILTLVGFGIGLLAVLVGNLDGGGSHPRVLRSSEVEFEDGKTWDGTTLKRGTYTMNKGTFEFHTFDSIGVIIEAPAKFTIASDHKLVLNQGRMVATVPSNAPQGLTIKTERFEFSTSEGEIGVVADEKSIDLLVFNGEGTIGNANRIVKPGEGLRFFDIGEPESFAARDEAHRFPESIPAVLPRAYGDNLIVNHSFEIGLLSRSCKTERLYRDIPLGWKAGWQRDGVWSEALEQHSGAVRITDAIGGLPTPIDGERYLWVNHGFVAQELNDLEPGADYQLSVQIGSHRNLGPGAGHLVRHIGGNVFRFGIWSGSEWIAETSGQLEAGQPFQEMKMKFKFPENGLPGMVPVLMLSGETRIFYDNIVLKKL